MKWQGESGFYYKKLDSTKCIWIKAYYYFVEIISDNNDEQNCFERKKQTKFYTNIR